MSWSIYTEATPVEEIDAALEQAKERSAAQLTSEESKDQLAATITAMRQLLESGAIGSPAAVRINLGGHANPLHEDAEGMAGESVSVSIAVVKPPVPAS